jgi:hypothetical protein
MHPVARVSIKYWKTSVRNTVFLVLDFIVHLFYCALITLHVSAPFGGHLQVFTNTKNIKNKIKIK